MQSECLDRSCPACNSTRRAIQKRRHLIQYAALAAMTLGFALLTSGCAFYQIQIVNSTVTATAPDQGPLWR